MYVRLRRGGSLIFPNIAEHINKAKQFTCFHFAVGLHRGVCEIGIMPRQLSLTGHDRAACALDVNESTLSCEIVERRACDCLSLGIHLDDFSLGPARVLVKLKER